MWVVILFFEYLLNIQFSAFHEFHFHGKDQNDILMADPDQNDPIVVSDLVK